MAGVKKPHPYIFEMALSKANVDPRNTLMVGDSLEADVMGAKAMGMKALHFNSNNEPDHEHCKTINNLIEIKSFL
jgi:putative hydrolase of the HAD superfamily